MVLVYPIPPLGQDFTLFCSGGGGGGRDFMDTDLVGMAKRSDDDMSLLQMAPFVNSGVEDPNKKIRKPYTITKSRESWTEEEHDRFLEALHLFDRDWKKIEGIVGSKTVIQIRSHAQKYFLKVQKNGKTEHVPPPRPKRKASHPYPQKAPKSDDSEVVGVTLAQNCSGSNNDSTPRIWTSDEINYQVKENQCKAVRVMPDFAQVYSYLGSIFDPKASDHLQRLRKMDPINVETILMLMKNLSINLVSSEFEDHRKLLSSRSVGIGNSSMGCTILSA